MSESHDRLLIPGWPVPLREATPYGQGPKYLIRDHDSKFGPNFARVARTSGIKILKTPYHAPRANAICERFLRSVRQECLDHLLIVQEKQLQRVLNAYVAYFNQARPHQGIQQQIPERLRSVPSSQDAGNKVIALPVMGGLHHNYHWAVFPLTAMDNSTFSPICLTVLTTLLMIRKLSLFLISSSEDNDGSSCLLGLARVLPPPLADAALAS